MINRSRQERIDLVKYLLDKVVSKRGTTQKAVLDEMHKMHGRNPRQSNFSARQARGTITAVELIEIFDYLDFRLATNDEKVSNNDFEKY